MVFVEREGERCVGALRIPLILAAPDRPDDDSILTQDSAGGVTQRLLLVWSRRLTQATGIIYFNSSQSLPEQCTTPIDAELEDPWSRSIWDGSDDICNDEGREF